jgi:glycosyltransferase involved in cell wall biosynthesis
MKISFCLITLNEAANLPRALKSCADLADEIVVLDSGSTDATEKIARESGARFETQKWLGYVGQKNKVLSLAQNEWVFSLDADEELSPALREEILALKKSIVPDGVSGFSLPRCVLFGGRWIRHGDWYPDRLVRLFRRDRAKFAGGQVHERLEISGEIQKLRGDLHHYSFTGTTVRRERDDKYARLWAEDKLAAGKSASPFDPIGHAVFRWLRCYVLRRGFLDGIPGWDVAWICSRETYLKYQLLRKLRKEKS